jgi:citrate lyase gamma subunit
MTYDLIKLDDKQLLDVLYAARESSALVRAMKQKSLSADR